MSEINIIYKGFNIRPDYIYGYSLYDSNGNWCQSKNNAEYLKRVVDCIFLSDIEMSVDEYWIAKNAILNGEIGVLQKYGL